MTRAHRAALAITVGVALVWGVMQVGPYAHGQIVDYPVYHRYGSAIVVHHAVPYRDFHVEYPPAALPVFVVPQLLSRLGYERVFKGLMALCEIAVVAAAWRLGGVRSAGVALAAPLLLGSIVYSRYDLWPAALLALALVTLVARRFAISAILLGTAFAAKFWPAVALPFVLVWLARTYARPAALRYLATTVVTALIWFVPFLIVAPSGIGYPFKEQLVRPLQIESLGSATLIAIHDLFGTEARTTFGYGSQNLGGFGTHAVAVGTSVIEVCALVALLVVFARGRMKTNRLLTMIGAAVAVMIAFGKVFSPQFLIWLFPLAVLARGRRAPVVIALFASALLLTQLYFPRRYWDYANGFAPRPLLLVLLRDLVVVALAVALAWPQDSEDEVLGEHRARIEALQRVGAQFE
jgi:Glycosyltransferase family 87